VPSVSDKALLVMVHELDTARIQVTVLNFSDRSIAARITSDRLPAGAGVTDMVTDAEIAEVHEDRGFPVELQPHQGRSLLIDPARSR
jgi:maltose alpha-D-glucosyltransferase/alpha-amylase